MVLELLKQNWRCGFSQEIREDFDDITSLVQRVKSTTRSTVQLLRVKPTSAGPRLGLSSRLLRTEPSRWCWERSGWSGSPLLGWWRCGWCWMNTRPRRWPDRRTWGDAHTSRQRLKHEQDHVKVLWSGSIKYAARPPLTLASGCTWPSLGCPTLWCRRWTRWRPDWSCSGLTPRCWGDQKGTLSPDLSPGSKPYRSGLKGHNPERKFKQDKVKIRNKQMNNSVSLKLYSLDSCVLKIY